MFNTKCLELVRTLHIENKVEFRPTVEYNKKLLALHRDLMNQSSCSRCVCPYNLKDTNMNKYYHKTRCKKCPECIGFLLYHIWSLNFSIDSCIKILNDNHQDLKFKESCFSHLKKYRKELKEELIKAHNLGL